MQIGYDLAQLNEPLATRLSLVPHYLYVFTGVEPRPEEIEGRRVPAVLLSGDHARIARWRYKQALGRSFLRRPDLVKKLNLDKEQRKLLDEFLNEQGRD